MRHLKILFLLALSLSMGLLSGCWQVMNSKLLVDDLPRDPSALSQAVELSVKDFFYRRMNNRVRKAPVGNWLVLHEDEGYVYVGYPSFRGLIDDRREIAELFRTSKAELKAQFPGWREIDGISLQEALYKALGQAPQNWQAELAEEAILVTGSLKPRAANAETAVQPFTLRLSKSDLKPL